MALQFALAATVLICISYNSAFGQSGMPRQPEQPTTPEPVQGQSYAPLGDSGYKVPIPVIRMKSIVGEKPSSKKPNGPVAPAPPEGAPEAGKIPPAEVQRLPFQHDDAAHEAKTPVEPPRVEMKPTREAPPVTTPRASGNQTRKNEVHGAAGGPVKGAPAEAPQPVEAPAAKETVGPRESPKPTEVRSSRREQTSSPGPGRTAPAKEEESTLSAPLAPREAIEPLPPLKKEILRRATEPALPSLLEGRPSKSSARPLTLSPTEADDLADPRGWIQLEPRKEPESIPGLEPEPLREPAQPDLHSRPETPSPPELQPETGPVRETQPAPVKEPPTKESIPAQPSSQESKEQPEPEDQAPPKEEVLPAVRESIPSPLGNDALDSREVRDYLQQTAPILEEISLLMARAPSLTVEDYDPADPNTAAIPKEIQVRMDAIKRDLQILDSKTFAIIPPTKYTRFHSLIRESITQTHKACDAILSYLADNKQESLQKAKEHVLRARDLIQRTRERGEQT